MKSVIYLMFACSLLFSCTNQQKTAPQETVVNQAEEQEALMNVNRQWAKAASPEQFLSFIKSDALLMAPDKGVIKGHEGIGAFLGEMQSIPGFKIEWEPQSATVSKSGDLGYTVDRILVSFDGENGETVKLFEKGITVWKKDAEGNWKMAVDIWNVDPSTSSTHS